MSGMVGQVNRKDNLERMLNVITYRGKNQKTYIDDFIGLAKCDNNKKSIYENGEYIVLFDGNIEHQSKSNEDYIVNNYKKYKEDAFIKIKGSFSICIYNRKEQELILVRDKFGRKPLYYRKDDFAFASEIKCLLEDDNYQRKLNKDILKDYFLYQTNPSDETIFKGIYKVPAGGIVIYKNGIVKDKKYYNFDFKNLIYDESELEEKIKANITNYFVFKKDTASFLSSGIDSSLIVSASKVKDTYTVSYDDLEYSESYHTESLCNTLNIKNNIKILSKKSFLKEIENIEYFMDEPCFDPAVIALYFGAKEAKGSYKYIYSGEGADELFAGYNSYLDTVKYRQYQKIPNFVKKIIYFGCNHMPEFKGVNFLLRRCGNVQNDYRGVARIFNERTLNKLLLKKYQKTNNYNTVIKNEYDDLEAMQIIDINNFLLAETNATERMCAVNDLEVIMPFLNDELVSIASNIPSSYKINGNITKQILTQKFAACHII